MTTCPACGLPTTDNGCTPEKCKAPRFIEGTGPRYGRPGVPVKEPNGGR